MARKMHPNSGGANAVHTIIYDASGVWASQLRSHRLSNRSSRMYRADKCFRNNRHVVGNERVLQERRKRLHLGLESCGEHREVLVEA
jgi:hypothetical protein